MSARAPIRPGTLALLGLGAALSLAVGLRSTWQNSITVDEFGHLPAGLNLLQTGDMRYAELNPPLMNSLNALPLLLADVPAVQVPEGGEDSRFSFWSNGAWFMEQRRSDYVLLFERARAVTVGLTVLMGLGAFGFARRLVPEHGDAAGLLAAALVWSSPEVLAHGALVTTDAGLAAFTLFSLSALHAWRVRPDAARAAGAGVLLGLCQLVKFSAVLLLPVVVGVLAHAVLTATEGRRARLGEAALLLAAAWLTLCAGYGFGGLGTPVGALSLGSAPLSALSGVWAGLPSPLPEAFLRAFDRQLADTAQGDPSYLLGEVYQGGRWSYFLTLLLLKTPLATLALGLFAALYARSARALAPLGHALLLAPAGLLLGVFSLASEKQIGLRLVLPAVVLGLVWIGANLARLASRRGARGLLGAVLLAQGASVARLSPDFLASTNPLVGDADRLPPIAVDSNLDWGQSLPELKKFMDNNEINSIQLLYFGRVDPALYGVSYTVPVDGLRPGYLAISRSLYGRGYWLYNHGKAPWVGPIPVPTGLERVAVLGHSMDVFRVP